ncbi:alpha/beta fold hydrolase [Rhodococcus hoagii]|nr:alpha/beta fold hydrolase [Prescottella equi]
MLVLPGGKASDRRRSKPWQAADLRMSSFTRTLRRSCPEVEVRQVRYLLRGWNGADRSPVHDVRRILDDLRPAQTPVVLVGHSMGARVAAVVADDPLVCGVLALAPWWRRGRAGACRPAGGWSSCTAPRTPGPTRRRRGDRPRWLRRGAWTPDGSVWRARATPCCATRAAGIGSPLISSVTRRAAVRLRTSREHRVRAEPRRRLWA